MKYDQEYPKIDLRVKEQWRDDGTRGVWDAGALTGRVTHGRARQGDWRKGTMRTETECTKKVSLTLIILKQLNTTLDARAYEDRLESLEPLAK